MYILQYPVEVEKDGDGYLVTFPDFDDALTAGDTMGEAMVNAEGALMEVIAARIAHKEEIPMPSPAKGRNLVTLPPQSAAKALLWVTMRKENLTRAELARRMGQEYAQVDRLFKFGHNSKLEQLTEAFNALGKKMIIGILD